MGSSRIRLIDDPAALAEAAALWRPIRARRLAREAAHAAGDHDLCRPQDDCQIKDGEVG